MDADKRGLHRHEFEGKKEAENSVQRIYSQPKTTIRGATLVNQNMQISINGTKIRLRGDPS